MDTGSKESLLRRLFGKVFHGFLLGVGFMLAAGSGAAVLYHYAMKEQQAASRAMMEKYQPTQKNLELSDLEETKHDGMTAIIGTVVNKGSSEVSSIQIQANLFNHGKFVDQYSTYVSGKLKAGESKHFKISCGCANSPPAEHDSYKVEIIRD